MPLSDTACRNAKPRQKPYKLTDAEGMHLLVQPNGSKLWRLSYRFDGKQKTLAFGSYPAVSLSDARGKRLDARRLLAGGVDPSAAKKAEALPIDRSNSFGEVACEWHNNRRSGWVAGHSERVWNRLERDVMPRLGGRPIAEIEAPEILEVLRRVEERGALDIAKRLRQSIGAIFRYGIAIGKAKRDPAADLRGALKTSPRPKHHSSLKASDIPDFLKRLEAYDGGEQTRLAIMLTLLTFVRTSETRFARWSEFEDLDGDAPIWRIPAERMKAGREHLVPLAPWSVKVIERLKELSLGGEYVFAAPTRSRVMSENTMIFALYRMGYHSRLTVHGFRGTASTVLNENGFNRDWIEMQLAHAPRDAVRAAYNSAEWLPGRREMMLWWANYLEDRGSGA